MDKTEIERTFKTLTTAAIKHFILLDDLIEHYALEIASDIEYSHEFYEGISVVTVDSLPAGHIQLMKQTEKEI